MCIKNANKQNWGKPSHQKKSSFSLFFWLGGGQNSQEYLLIGITLANFEGKMFYLTGWQELYTRLKVS